MVHWPLMSPQSLFIVGNAIEAGLADWLCGEARLMCLHCNTRAKFSDIFMIMPRAPSTVGSVNPSSEGTIPNLRLNITYRRLFTPMICSTVETVHVMSMGDLTRVFLLIYARNHWNWGSVVRSTPGRFFHSIVVWLLRFFSSRWRL